MTWDTDENRALVLQIFEQKHSPSVSLLQSLARIALAGGFAGTAHQWGCGSWLAQRVRDAIAQSEQQDTSFPEVLVEEGREASLEAWEKVVDSYLILPIESYKSLALLLQSRA